MPGVLQRRCARNHGPRTAGSSHNGLELAEVSVLPQRRREITDRATAPAAKQQYQDAIPVLIARWGAPHRSSGRAPTARRSSARGPGSPMPPRGVRLPLGVGPAVPPVRPDGALAWRCGSSLSALCMARVLVPSTRDRASQVRQRRRRWVAIAWSPLLLLQRFGVVTVRTYRPALAGRMSASPSRTGLPPRVGPMAGRGPPPDRARGRRARGCVRRRRRGLTRTGANEASR